MRAAFISGWLISWLAKTPDCYFEKGFLSPLKNLFSNELHTASPPDISHTHTHTHLPAQKTLLLPTRWHTHRQRCTRVHTSTYKHTPVFTSISTMEAYIRESGRLGAISGREKMCVVIVCIWIWVLCVCVCVGLQLAPEGLWFSQFHNQISLKWRLALTPAAQSLSPPVCSVTPSLDLMHI